MKIYEIVNYYSDCGDSLEAREVLARYRDENNAVDRFWKIAQELGVHLMEDAGYFEVNTPALDQDYYQLEEHETDD